MKFYWKGLPYLDKFYRKGRNSRDLAGVSPHDPSEPLTSIPITVPNGFYAKPEGLEEI